MKTIKARVNSTLILLLISSGILGYYAFKHHKEAEDLQNLITESLNIRDAITESRYGEHEWGDIVRLKKFRNQTTDEKRRNSVSNMIQALTANNPRLYKTRVKEFEKSEHDFFRLTQWQIKKSKKESYFYGLLAMATPLVGLLWFVYLFNFSLIAPLETLSKRMMEFLTDQYTFRFSSPANNEIGNLERTFNSLAQKVLNNIDELKSLDRAKSEFVNIASHELRTPLTSIKGSLGLLSSEVVGTLDPEAKEMVLIAEQETDRLVRLINDMLDLAKMESRSLQMEKDWVDLTELFEKTTLSLQGFATTAQVSLKIVELQRESLQILADGDRIQQVLTNLISNAIKFSPSQGCVFIKAQVQIDGSLEISVIDQGPGISEANQILIFEKFRQATDSTNHLVKGTGLGLAISKALIEEHGGTIGVRSTPGQGCCFYFTLRDWREAPLSTETLKVA